MNPIMLCNAVILLMATVMVPLTMASFEYGGGGGGYEYGGGGGGYEYGGGGGGGGGHDDGGSSHGGIILDGHGNKNIDLGTFVGKHTVPPKVIRIVKTVAVKIPVPYPVRVPHGVPYPVPVPKPYPVPVTQIVRIKEEVPVHLNHGGSSSSSSSSYPSFPSSSSSSSSDHGSSTSSNGYGDHSPYTSYSNAFTAAATAVIPSASYESGYGAGGYGSNTDGHSSSALTDYSSLGQHSFNQQQYASPANDLSAYTQSHQQLTDSYGANVGNDYGSSAASSSYAQPDYSALALQQQQPQQQQEHQPEYQQESQQQHYDGAGSSRSDVFQPIANPQQSDYSHSAGYTSYNNVQSNDNAGHQY